MPPGERQRLIVEIAAEAIGQPIRHSPTFQWMLNQHRVEEFGPHFDVIERIFSELGGCPESAGAKRVTTLKSDAYIGGDYNCLLEFDEFQHFSSARAIALRMLPPNIPLGFSRVRYLEYCQANSQAADLYRFRKRTSDFDFDGGRTAQRAYFDCFRDLLPTVHGLRPTIRITAFEVESIDSNCAAARKALKRIIAERVPYTD